MTYLAMGKIMQAILDDIGSSQFVLKRVIEYLISESKT